MNLVKKVLKSRPAIAFAASFLVTMLIFAVFGYAPFGLKSVAGADANIQYLDLFAYLKDVLAREKLCHIYDERLARRG